MNTEIKHNTIDKKNPKIYTYNVSTGYLNHSQRNNKHKPFATCNLTSATMMIKYNHYDDKKFNRIDNLVQFEDYLYNELHKPEAISYYEKTYPSFVKAGYPPEQIWAMIVWSINRFVGKKVCYLDGAMSLKEMAYELAVKKKSMVVGGQFTKTGHIVTMVGVKSYQDLSKLKSANDVDLNKIVAFTIDDPYGDWTTGYKVHTGNDIDLTYEETNNVLRSYNDAERKLVIRSVK